MKIRFAYQKLREAKYIAHLDLTRVLDRALRRAEIPVAYSQGFNPHPKISFGPPLAVGVEGLAEYVDVEVQEKEQEASMAEKERWGAEFMQKLQTQMPPLIPLTAHKVLPAGTPALTAAIDLACYQVTWPGRERRPAEERESLLKSWLAQKEVLVWRKSKGQTLEKDIRPFVRHLAWLEEDMLLLEIQTGNAGSVIATEVLNSLSAFDGFFSEASRTEIVRTGLYVTKEQRRRTPLELN